MNMSMISCSLMGREKRYISSKLLIFPSLTRRPSLVTGTQSFSSFPRPPRPPRSERRIVLQPVIAEVSEVVLVTEEEVVAEEEEETEAVDAEDVVAVERKRKIGFQSLSSAVSLKMGKSRAWKKSISSPCPSKNTKSLTCSLDQH